MSHYVCVSVGYQPTDRVFMQILPMFWFVHEDKASVRITEAPRGWGVMLNCGLLQSGVWRNAYTAGAF